MPGFFSTVITVIVHTPIWVWPLYVLLLFLGLQRTRDSAIPLLRMLILPLVVVVLAIISGISAGVAAFPAVLLGLVVGGVAGWQLERDGATRRQPDGRIWLRGEWWSFTQLVLVMIFRYASNVAAALDPALYADLGWHLGTGFVSAALSASFLGRTAARLRAYLRQRPAPAVPS